MFNQITHLFQASLLGTSAILTLLFFFNFNQNHGKCFSERTVVAMLLFSAYVSLSGIVLSSINHLGNPNYWILLFAPFLVGFALTSKQKTLEIPKLVIYYFSRERNNLFVGFIFILLGIYLVRASVTYPYNWDSLTCHIPRVFYYINQGNYSYLGSPYWAQEIHPINFTSIQILFFHIFNNITCFNLISYFSLLIFWIEIYIFINLLTNKKSVSFFFSGILWFCVNITISLSSTQNDSYLAFVIFGSFITGILYLKSGNHYLLFVSALSLFNAFGIKQTSPLIFAAWLPCVFLIPEFWKAIKLNQILKILSFSPLFILIGCFFYYKNYQNFGHFSGFPEIIKDHGSLSDINFMIYEGPKNFLRYMLDFLSTDGLYFNTESQIFSSKISHAIKQNIHNALLEFNLDLTIGHLRDKFYVSRPSGMDDSRSAWGLFGIFIFIPIVVLTPFYYMFFDRRKEVLILFCSVILFLVINSIFSTYDQGRARHFIHIIPVLSALILKLCDNKWIKNYVIIALILSAINVILSSIFNEKRPFFSSQQNIFSKSRFVANTENRSSADPIFERIELSLRPFHNIALMMPENSIEIFYFGKEFDKDPRHFYSPKFGKKPIPESYEVLLFCSWYEKPLPKDLYIGQLNKDVKIYIRKLKSEINKPAIY